LNEKMSSSSPELSQLVPEVFLFLLNTVLLDAEGSRETLREIRLSILYVTLPERSALQQCG